LSTFQPASQGGGKGPFLSNVSSGQYRSSLFFAVFFQTQAAFQLRDAILISCETDIPSDFLTTCMVLPNLTIFQQVEVEAEVAPVSKFLAKTTNQKYLTQWYRMTSGERKELARLRTAYHPLETRLAHSAPIEHPVIKVSEVKRQGLAGLSR
jgi:hypothetical protein